MTGAEHGFTPDFLHLDEQIPGLQISLAYSGSDNFLGRPATGYLGARAMLCRPAVMALRRVQEDLRAFGLALKVFDAYRPQRAVDEFVRWANTHDTDPGRVEHYPGLEKSRLLADGYIASHSAHSRGAAVDLTLVALDEHGRPTHELDMGTRFDHFGPESAPHYLHLPTQQRSNRALLQWVMQRHHFIPYPKEWWHFTLANEPYPDTYFDILPWAG